MVKQKISIELRLKQLDLQNELQEVINNSLTFQTDDVLPVLSITDIKEAFRKYKGPPIGCDLDGFIETGRHLLSIIIRSPITSEVIASVIAMLLYEEILQPFRNRRKRLQKNTKETNEVIFPIRNNFNLRIVFDEDIQPDEFKVAFAHIDDIINLISQLLQHIDIQERDDFQLQYLNSRWRFKVLTMRNGTDQRSRKFFSIFKFFSTR